MTPEHLIELGRTYLSPALYRSTQLVWERAEGSYLITAEGERYLGFISGIAVQNIGHNHPEVEPAARAQVEKLIHTCFATGYYAPAVELPAQLAAAPGDLDSVFSARKQTTAACRKHQGYGERGARNHGRTAAVFPQAGQNSRGIEISRSHPPTTTNRTYRP